MTISKEETDRTIRIVHLSDLHFSRVGEQDNHDREALLEDIASFKNPLDIVAITGDLTIGCGNSGFDAAESWIDKLVQKVKLPKHRVFLVPGNHDVNRKAPLPDIDLSEIENDPSQNETGDALNDHLDEWRGRHTRFLSLMNKYRDDNDHSVYPWWNQRVEIRGYYVSLLGLCSTWLSGINLKPDKGRLNVGSTQLKTSEDFADSVLKLALIHHPWSYLTDLQEAYMSHAVSEKCDIVLRGHRHRQATTVRYTPDRSLLELEAGACQANGGNPAAYQYIEFDTHHREAKVHYRAWDDIRKWDVDRNIYGALKDDGTAVYYLPKDVQSLREKIKIEDSYCFEKKTRTITIPMLKVWSKKEGKDTTINPLSSDVLWAMIHAIKNRPSNTTILITGEGRQFCSGLDLKEIMKKNTFQGQLTLYYELLHVIDTHPPVVALINGPAVAGGAGIALFAQFAVGRECNSVWIELPSDPKYRKLARTVVPFIQHRRKPDVEVFKDFLDTTKDAEHVKFLYSAAQAKKARLIDEVCANNEPLELTAMTLLAKKNFDPEIAWEKFKVALSDDSVEDVCGRSKRLSAN